MDKIIQWNVRGILRNLDDVQELLSKFNAKVLCVQETHLTPKHKDFLRQYIIFRKDREDPVVPSGGVAIIADRSIACQHLKLPTALEAVAIRAVLFNKLITICSVYIPPHQQLHRRDLESLIDELPEPFLVLGDFNAHNVLWGDAHCDARGRLIEQLLFSSSLCLLNMKEPTYFSLANNTYSSIDLSISSPSLLPVFKWNVLKNPYGSDHFPIILSAPNKDQLPPQVPR